MDGQQRLNSLTLLLIHLEHCTIGLENIADLGRLIYSNDYGSATFKIDVPERRDVMEAIRRGDTLAPANASQSVRTIWERYQDINRLFSEELTGHALPYFCDWLLNHVVLVEIGTTDQDMALDIFETMNDRGLRLSNTDMLKAYILTHIKGPETILAINTLWRQRITDLTDLEKNADSEFLKNWLHGKYAASIRERKKDALSKDFDLIGTAFHKWVRDNKTTLYLHQPSDYANFVDHDFDRLSQRYIHLLVASNELTAGLEHVFYNASMGFTLQHLPITAHHSPASSTGQDSPSSPTLTDSPSLTSRNAKNCSGKSANRYGIPVALDSAKRRPYVGSLPGFANAGRHDLPTNFSGPIHA